ncbi:MAG: putative membrane protein YeiH [Flavobacterium sp.]|jgi:uncharacterized membrane protein YeiH
MFQILDVIGVLVFAISGVLSGLNKKLDAFGVFIIAFVTSLGGGTLRDILIGKMPVGWMVDLKYLYLIVIAYFITVFFKKYLEKLRISLFLFDSIGLGVFTIIGIERGIEYGLHPIICIALGTLTASFGGVIRDILCNEIPIIFRKEIYATVCILGGILFFVLQKINLNHDILYVITSLFMISFRLLSIKYKWCLPSLYRKG